MGELAIHSEGELAPIKLAGDRPQRSAAAEKTKTAVERTSSAGGTIVSELERLAGLHRRGELTADEFGRAKKRVLAGPSD